MGSLVGAVARWLDRHDLTLGENVAEIVIQAGQRGRGRETLQADEQLVADIARRMVIAIESGNLIDRFVDIVGNLEQVQIARCNQALLQHVALQKIIPVVPIGAARGIHEDYGHQSAFAGL